MNDSTFTSRFLAPPDLCPPRTVPIADPVSFTRRKVVVWKYPGMTKLATLTGHSLRVLYLAASPDGKTIVTGAGDETLRFWNVFPGMNGQNDDLGQLHFILGHVSLHTSRFLTASHPLLPNAIRCTRRRIAVRQRRYRQQRSCHLGEDHDPMKLRSPYNFAPSLVFGLLLTSLKFARRTDSFSYLCES